MSTQALGMSADKREAMEARKARRPAGPAPGSGLALCAATNRVMALDQMATGPDGQLYDPTHAPKGSRPYQAGDEAQAPVSTEAPAVSASAVQGLPSSRAAAPPKRVGSRAAAKRAAKDEAEDEAEDGAEDGAELDLEA